jgi:hypothetical protein
MTIRVLEITLGPCRNLLEQWNALGIDGVRIPYERALEAIQGPASAAFIFEAIVIHCRQISADEHPFANRPTRELLLLIDAIRSLPQQCAMFDGKKWCSIPIIAIASQSVFAELLELREARFGKKAISSDEIVFVTDIEPQAGADSIKSAVVAYRFAVLAELDNMGFMVQYANGRYCVGHALRRRSGLDGRYYFGPGDRRPDGFFTVHKDNLGIQVEVEKFEALINRPDVTELELQKFFEEHPHFLSRMHTPLPHVRLSGRDGSVLIPDFILRPIVAQQRDSSWEVLDLKKPQERLLAGKGSRARLSSKVIAAIRQLRDYKEHFNNPDHAQEIASLLGHRLKFPKLGVLIGRLANTDVEALQREQEYQTGVRIVTYDEILEEQQAQIDR